MGEERAALLDTIAVQRRRQVPGDRQAEAPGFGHPAQVRCAPSVGSQGTRHILQPRSAPIHSTNFNQHFPSPGAVQDETFQLSHCCCSLDIVSTGTKRGRTYRILVINMNRIFLLQGISFIYSFGIWKVQNNQITCPWRIS